MTFYECIKDKKYKKVDVSKRIYIIFRKKGIDLFFENLDN